MNIVKAKEISLSELINKYSDISADERVEIGLKIISYFYNKFNRLSKDQNEAIIK